jgi:choline monooxygenase
VANPGQYRSIETVGGPALIVKDEAGTLRAFANFCRHRGALLLEGCGTARKILCPYHAWSYRLNGAVLAAPSMDETDGFDKAEYGLLPIRLETWAGFVFINYSNDAPSVKDDIGDLADLLDSHNMSDMVVTWRKDIEAQCATGSFSLKTQWNPTTPAPCMRPPSARRSR